MHRNTVFLPLLVLFTSFGYAQDKATQLSGRVTDPAGYMIPGATIAITPESSKSTPPQSSLTSTSDSSGAYHFSHLVPGSYTVTVEATGFAPYHRAHVAVRPDSNLDLKIQLEIATQQDTVNVSSDKASLTDPSNNATSLVLKKDQIDLLPTDSTQLLQQLKTMAGGDATLFVDGYSGGTLPPKENILQIRINQNPYSAKNDSNPTSGMIEIITKPGTSKLHGSFTSLGYDSAFNTNSPFIQQQPSYYLYYWNGNLSGPLSKHASYFLSGGQDISRSNSIVSAIILDSNNNQTPFHQAVPTSSNGFNLNPRLDFQAGKSTVSIRYNFSHSSSTNGGVGQLSLASQGTDSTSQSQMLQIGNTQVIGAKLVNETHFQLSRSDSSTTPYSTDPSISVAGAFNGGGSPSGSSKSITENYELRNDLYIVAGKHYLDLGGRLRVFQQSGRSTANYNGQYLFSSLAAYQITVQGLQDHLTGPQIRAMGGGASQFTLTAGNPSVDVTASDVGLYYQDDWKWKPTLTLSYGLRYEAQSKVSGQAWAPRFGFSWALGATAKKPPQFVVGGGAGIFYRRFPNGDIVNAALQNGIKQQEYVVPLPDFYPSIPSPATLGTQVAPSIYQISPHLKADTAYVVEGNIARPITGKGRSGNFRVDALYAHGLQNNLIRNINAPLPGTYNPADPDSGVRPYGGTRNINEYESGGTSYYFRLAPSVNISAKRYFIVVSYNLVYAQTDTDGGFPSNGYDLRADRGRPSISWDSRNQLNLYGSANLPFGITSSLSLSARSGYPFNIVVGQDLNGDSQYNDRPAFATDLSRPSVVTTRFGNFDTSPIAGQKIIPIDYGRGPSNLNLNLTLGRIWTFGPRPAASPATKASKAAPKAPGKYSLNLSATAENVINHVNLGQPIGTLNSPLFGHSNSVTSGSANRMVYLQMNFQF